MKLTLFLALALSGIDAAAVGQTNKPPGESGSIRTNTPIPSSTYFGMCDASAVVALDPGLFAVGNDEDNPIRVYSAETGGSPVAEFRFDRFLRLERKHPEMDTEAACWFEDRIFWITSHGRSTEGQFRPNRHRFFALEVRSRNQKVDLVPVGRPYTSLLMDLVADPRYARFGLAKAMRLPPKAPGGFNIEGMCPSADSHHLYIGLRNPIPNRQAMLVLLYNPNEVISGKPARFGDPVFLDLGGLGVRDMALYQGQILIVAGSYDGRGKSVLYLWSGDKTPPRRLNSPDTPDFNPEAVVVYKDRGSRVQVLSDDGTRAINGSPCKLLRDPMQRCFRSEWMSIPITK